MQVKQFLLTTALVTAGIGATLLLFPGFIADFFLPNPAHGSDIFIRFLGSTLIGYTYLNWATTTYDHLASMHATLIGNFSTLFIALLVSIWATLDKTLKTTGWLIVLLHATFAFGFACYLYQLSKHPKQGAPKATL